MIEVELPDGRIVEVNTTDPGIARETARKFLAKESAPKEPETGSTGTVNALTGGIISGVPIVGPLIEGGAQRAAAGIRSLMSGSSFENELKAVRDYAAQAKKEHPVASLTGELTGGIGSMAGLGATAAGARLLGINAPTLPAMMARGAVSGSAINAADATVRGEDPIGAAGIGGAVGGLAPPIGRLASAVASPVINVVRGIRDPAAEASRRVAGAIQRDQVAGGAGLDPAGWAAARTAGQPVNMMDLGGETTRAVARSAANTSPEGRAVLNRSLDQRFEGQSERLASWFNSTFHFPNAPAQQEALEQAARGVNRAGYRQAYQEGDRGLWSPELERFTSSPDVVSAMQAAATKGKSRAVNEGFGGFNPGVTFNNGILGFQRGRTGQPSYPTLQFWDYTKRELDDAARAARRQGRNEEAMTLEGLARGLRAELDRMVPSYAQARAGAAHFFGAENALEAGQNFVTARLGNREARAALARMSPLERRLFQDGFVDRITQMVRESPDRRSVLNRLAQSPAEREKLRIALGQRADDLEAMLRVEGIMDLARPAVQGNSTTARQLAELGLAGGAYGLSTGGNILNPDPQSLMNAALVYGAARGRHAIDNRVAERVARLLASNDPTQLRRGMALLTRNQTLFNSLRQADAGIASIVARGSLPAVQ